MKGDPMRNQAMTIPGANWWGTLELVATDFRTCIPQFHLGRRLYESVLLLGILALMSVTTVGTIVLVVCTVAEAVAGAQ
jgi:hypothetical protein